MRGTIALAALAGLVGLGGCINTSSVETPEWFSERSAENDSSYPSLRSVPRDHDANVDAAHWATVEADVVAAGQAVKQNPRSEPASQAETPAEFLDEAREDLEETRQSHEP
jgi:hypothetical protein